MAQIVVLGGGFGGVVAATALRNKLGREHKVILIDKKQDHLFTPSLLWLIVDERKPEKIQRDLNVLNKKGIEYINAEIQRVHPTNKTVSTSTGEVRYDYLIISLGAEVVRDVIPGYRDGINFYCLKGAEVLRDELKSFKGGKIAVVVASTPFKCPAAPYEAALLIDAYLSKKGIREKTEIAIYTPETLPMPVAGPVLGNTVKELLEKRGISFNPQKKLVSMENREISFEGGEKFKADLIAWVPPHRSPAVVRDSGLTNETGWIPVDGKTMKTQFEGVYAIGDITANKLPSGMMLPKAGVFAHGQAEVVANNIAAEISKTGELKEFDGQGYCFLEMGQGIAGFASGNFYAEPKPLVNLKNPGRLWHWGKVAFEKWWLWKWF
ncbi:MAG: FAD/NAD(P)-binding oxidoreductase [Deltaproteobacteria bacterium]|nr:FAD/NAD(P)-binding oxidoreductase [Deltaproteobacteria bacterium]